MPHATNSDRRGRGRPPDEGILTDGIRTFIEIAAASRETVLLEGETGTGKGHIARIIHAASRRGHGELVKVNCPSIPEPLFERELFGHVRGAYTGAAEWGPGFFERAHRGTLLLDEIGELPVSLQPRLLAALEDRWIYRVGSPERVEIDVRVIAATNRDLEAEVGAGRFRPDLFHRLAVLRFTVPPLRKRPGDIPRLIDNFLDRIAEENDRTRPEVEPVAMARLTDYSWPGNIRELENVLRSALAHAPGGAIHLRHLPRAIAAHMPRERRGMPGPVHSSPGRNGWYLAPADPDKEADLIRRALQAEHGNRTRAARRLGMSRATLYTKLSAYRIGFGSRRSVEHPP